MAWDNLVTIANQSEVKAYIYNIIYLDQRYPSGKRSLKMKDSSQDK